MTLPKSYAWLAKETGPRLLVTALQMYGTIETPGPGNNPSIMTWAKKVKLSAQYKADSTAWCGLFMAYVALQSGWDAVPNPLLARSWRAFGKRAKTPMLGDVLVFWRESRKGFKGHVGIYIAEDGEAYYVLGGNQGDKVSIKRIAKTRLLEARRCPWKINQPKNVRRVFIKATGTLSTNEA
jgi:uncharacterized protein (TIGR02594 family)